MKLNEKTSASLSRSALGPHAAPFVASESEALVSDQAKKDRNATRRPAPVLLTEEGQKLCRAMRRETWFTLMASSADPTMRRLGSAIFVAAAMNELVASRASWGPQGGEPRQRRPAIARADRPRSARAPREPRLTDDHVAEIRASDEMGRVLAQRYGVSESTISRVRQGAPKPNRSHLTPAEQAAIRGSGESIRGLARHYGVSWSTVARLRQPQEDFKNTEAHAS